MNKPDMLANFQRVFGQHLRDPAPGRCPEGIPVRRAQIYRELLFNNVRGFLDACFPVCRDVLGEARWSRLARDFFRDWRSQTPYFSRIPLEFVRYLALNPLPESLPEWFTDLAHYEWIELEVDLAEEPCGLPIASSIEPVGLRVNPTLRLLFYRWPVHTISTGRWPEQPAETMLLVFRDFHFSVQFVEVNALTAQLVALAMENSLAEEALLDALAEETHLSPTAPWMSFGKDIIEDLIKHQILYR